MGSGQWTDDFQRAVAVFHPQADLAAPCVGKLTVCIGVKEREGGEKEQKQDEAEGDVRDAFWLSEAHGVDVTQYTQNSLFRQ